MELLLTDWMFNPLWCRKILELVFLIYKRNVILPAFTDQSVMLCSVGTVLRQQWTAFVLDRFFALVSKVCLSCLEEGLEKWYSE